MNDRHTNSQRPGVLIIANAFPPSGGAGVQRAAKFAKYLSRAGWRVHVWSADSIPALPIDETLSRDIPEEVRHHSIPTEDPMARAAKIFKPLEERLSHRPALASRIGGLAWRLGTFTQKALALLVPDDQRIWAHSSYRRALRLIEEQQIDVIFSTYSPASNHLLAMWLKKKTNLPWIADFRDLWTDDCEYVGHSALRTWLDRSYERTFLKKADAITAVTNGQRDILASRLPNEKSKFHTITNGIDFEDFEKVAWCRQASHSRADNRPFRLTFAGQFRETRVCDEYLEGIAAFSRTMRERQRPFEFRIVGQVSNKLQKKANDLSIPLVATGYMPHCKAIEEMMDADVLLLSTARGRNSHTVLPGKVFEYLGSGRPILVIGDSDSTAARFVRTLGDCMCVPRDTEKISNALTELHEKWQDGELATHCDRNSLAPFGRDALADKLAKIMAELIGFAPPQPETENESYEQMEAVIKREAAPVITTAEVAVT